MPSALPDVPPLPAHPQPSAVRREAARRLRPPARVKVSEAAERLVVLDNPGGGYRGPYKAGEAPYMIDPADALLERRCTGLVFCGPAQSGKTQALVLNPVAVTVEHDPADMLIVQPTEKIARDFSRRALARLHRRCRRLRADLVDDNVFDKTYRGGMILGIGPPTVAELSGRAIPRVIFTDYDRMPLDVEGEGAPFDLGRQRIKTFGSRGICAAESSPGQPLQVKKWRQPEASPHMAPPAPGILALYNRGDRRRWYWPCPHCGERFEGDFELLQWAESGDLAEVLESVVMVCPSHGCLIEPAAQTELNERAQAEPGFGWLTEREIVAGQAVSQDIDAAIWSFWLKGVAAAFLSWPALVRRWLEALAELEETGEDQALKTTVNQDQGKPYSRAKILDGGSLEADELVAKAEAFPLGVVPAAARYLVASVDVQSRYFDVLVRAYGQADSWTVDRFMVSKIMDGDRERPVEPAVRAGDWDLLVDQVLRRRYPLEGRPGATMGILRVGVDSGGAAGATTRAYQFYRRLRRAGLAERVLLMKGTATPSAPRLAQRFPDSKRKDRKAAARGEIPVWFFHTNLLKDELDADLRAEDGAGRYHQSQGLLNEQAPHDWFEGLTAEERDDRSGAWVQIKKRNEPIDLSVMCAAARLAVRGDRIDWSEPPEWAAEWDDNNQVEAGEAEAEGEGEAMPQAESPTASTPAPRVAARRRPYAGFVKGW